MKPNLPGPFLEETTYLLASSANSKRLLEAVARDRAGVPARSLDEVLTVLQRRLEGAEDVEVLRRR